MICKDCRPIRTTSEHGPIDAVQLCKQHEALAARNDTLTGILANRLVEERERRRHALLQAAAVIFAGTYVEIVGHDEFTDEKYCVDKAEKLLAELERREPKPKREAEG